MQKEHKSLFARLVIIILCTVMIAFSLTTMASTSGDRDADGDHPTPTGITEVIPGDVIDTLAATSASILTIASPTPVLGDAVGEVQSRSHTLVPSWDTAIATWTYLDALEAAAVAQEAARAAQEAIRIRQEAEAAQRARDAQATTPTAPEGTSPPGAITTWDQVPTIMRRVAGCESQGDPDAGPIWDAKNPTSTASGAFQDLASTWSNYRGYSEARWAPPAIQIEFNMNLYRTSGLRPWFASRGCWEY